MTNEYQFHAVNQQNQVGSQNKQSINVDAGGGEETERELQRFLAAAMKALPTGTEQPANDTESPDRNHTQVFADDGDVARYLLDKTPASVGFWEKLEPVRGALRKAFNAMGKSVIENWVKRNPRVQPLLDFAKVLIDELV